MPFAKNAAFKIHYEVEGDGAPLVFLHGLTVSLECWRQPEFIKTLKENHRLILIDARGHGASDKPHDPQAYRLEWMVNDVLAVLDDLKINKAHIFGYSMGGWMGLGMARYAPERIHSLIIGGYGPKNVWMPERRDTFIKFFSQGMERYLEMSRASYGKWWTPEVQAVIQANDLEALTALVSSAGFLALPGLADLLASVTVPCLLYVGEEDESYPNQQDSVKQLANATFVSFPGLNHLDVGFRFDLVLPHVTQFLAEMSLV